MKKLLLIIAVLVLMFGCTEELPANPDPAPDDASVVIETESEEDDSADMGDVKDLGITHEELAKHNTEGDCWIVYEDKVYDYSNAPKHPNMGKTIFAYCGQETGFEESARAKHPGSNEGRVANYGALVGDLVR